MSDVQFDEAPAFMPASSAAKSQTRGMTITDRVISWGLAKDQKSATQVLLGALIICVGVTCVVFFVILPHHRPGPTPADIARMQTERFAPPQ